MPKAVWGTITTREFKRKVGDSEKEALAAWPRIPAQVGRGIAAVLDRMERAKKAAAPDVTGRAAYAAAVRRRCDMLDMGRSGEELVQTGGAWLDWLPSDARWEPIGVSPVDRHTINLLRLGPER